MKLYMGGAFGKNHAVGGEKQRSKEMTKKKKKRDWGLRDRVEVFGAQQCRART
jgi:hypothetical protein